MHYYAFVTRDANKRYSAELPDFPGCFAYADSLAGLTAETMAAVVRHSDERRHWTLPVPTSFSALPRMADALDGFWILVDLASCKAVTKAAAEAC